MKKTSRNTLLLLAAMLAISSALSGCSRTETDGGKSTDEIKSEATDQETTPDESNTEKTPDETDAETKEEKPSLIPQSFLGEWYAKDKPYGDAYPIRITVTGISERFVYFTIVDRGLLTNSFYARKVDDGLEFVEQNNQGEMCGKILFEDDGITVIFEDFGTDPYMPDVPYVMEFPIKAD